jgi:hypothetical protein
VEQIKNQRKRKRKTQDPALASLPATQDLVARLKSYADDDDDDKGGDKEEGNNTVEAEEEDEGYSTDSLEEEVQRSRRCAVVRRNLGHDCLNPKLLAAHIREQTNAVAMNLVNVNDVGNDKDTPSKRTSKRLYDKRREEEFKRLWNTP